MASSLPEIRYVLTDVYQAHSMDVRVVKPAIFPGALITGSQDSHIKFWFPNAANVLQEHRVFAGATNCISSLCALQPSAQYPTGLILAGSSDCAIYGFTLASPEPIMRLLGHSEAVCALSAGKFAIVSGSLDKTARIWFGQQCVSVLSGHQQSVCATEMFPTQNHILTGSTDHTIRLWLHTGTCERIFYGHEDCVTDLAVISEEEFLSCSSDRTARLWKISGECLAVYQGHENNIYSITLMNNEFDFATCGEDQNVHLWSEGKCIQKVAVPCKSLWSLACLSNGDIAVGGSDGRLYVLKKFTPEMYAELKRIAKSNCSLHHGNEDCDCGVLPTIHACVEVIAIGGQSNENILIGDQSIGDCATSEDARDFSNLIPCDGDKRHIVDEVTGTLLVWNAATERWEMEPDEKGDEYIVFNVAIEETMYRLCFHRKENPRRAAEDFVAKNNLRREHVDHVFQFIIKNTESAGNVAPGNKQPIQQVIDNFVVRNYCLYHHKDLMGIKGCLLKFNERVPEALQIPSSQIDNLVALAYEDRVTVELLTSLDLAIMWNDEFRFPVLDLLRLAVRFKGMAGQIGHQSFITRLLFMLNSTNQCINRILIIQILCNLFSTKEGMKAVLESQSKIYESVKEAIFISDAANIQKAGISLFLNFAVAATLKLPVDLNVYCITLLELLGMLSDPEAFHQCLVAVGTLYASSSLPATYFRSLNINRVIQSYGNFSENPKVMEALKALNILIGN